MQQQKLSVVRARLVEPDRGRQKRPDVKIKVQMKRPLCCARRSGPY